MVPILWLGGLAAAFFLSGCSKNHPEGSDKNAETSPGTGPKPANTASNPSPSKGPESPSRPDQYFTGFATDLRAADLYQRLVAKNISNAALDRGCSESLLPGAAKLAQDFRIDACEVYEFVLRDPSKYREELEVLSGLPLPWSLDDGYPDRKADDEIQVRVKNTVDKLKQSPAIKPLGMKSDQYARIMGQALTLFSEFPDDPKYLKEHQKELREKSSVLAELGLQDFQEELLEKGGLGASLFTDESGAAPPGAAIQVLTYRFGSAGSQAKVIYGVFEQAGLKPVFVMKNYEWERAATEGKIKDEIRARLNFGGMKFRYLRTAVQLEDTDKATGQARLFLPATLQDTRKPELDFKRLGLSMFLAENFHELGDYLLTKSKGVEKAMQKYKLALNLSPDNSEIYNSVGLLMERATNTRQAEIGYKEALRLDRSNGVAAFNLAELYRTQENWEGAVEFYSKAQVNVPALIARYSDNVSQAAREVLKTKPNDEQAKGLLAKVESLHQGPTDKSDAKRR